MSTTQHDTVRRYFEAMQAGSEAEAELAALFAEDATYITPLLGEPLEVRGRDAIMAVMRKGWEQSPPDMVLTVHRIDVDGSQVRATWSCASPIWPAPMRGEDRYEIVDRQIARLEVTLQGSP